jgi:hypothetical protein
VFRSGQSVLSYTAQNIAVNYTAAAALDSEGTGTFESLGAHSWADSAKGFLWWESRSGAVFPQPNGFVIADRDNWKMRLMLASPLADPTNLIVGTNVPSNVSIKLWFSGPVANAQILTFVGQGGAADVEANLTRTADSAFVTAYPSTALVPGASYQLTTSDGVVHSEWAAPLDPDAFHLDLTVAP